MSSVPFYGPTATGAASGGPADIRSAIAVAAQSTGVDFNYLLAQARLESNLDPAARAATSSAAGLYQFTGGTWLATLDRHGASHGLGWAEQAIEGDRVVDPALHSHIMALRHDPQIAALMAGELANDNRTTLSAALGREPDSAELYLAHFLGADGATRFLGALAANPGQSAATVLPRAAAANHAIFYERSGAPRSVAGVMDLLGRNSMPGRRRHRGQRHGPRRSASRWPIPCAAPSIWAMVPLRPAMSGPPMAACARWGCKAQWPASAAPPRWRFPLAS